MTTSRFPEITDELLSAYIDNAISDNERALIEAALREDSAVAWRLATLRETVQLLRALPMLQAPRSFALTPEQVGQSLHEPIYAPSVASGATTTGGRTLSPARPTPAAQPGRWAEVVERWRRFWQAGSPVWRNAMATSMAILLALVMLPAFLTNDAQQTQLAAPQPISEVFDKENNVAQSDAAPAQSEAEATMPAATARSTSLEAPATASAGDSQAPLAMQSAAAESPTQPELDPQAMEAPRSASPSIRNADPLGIPPDTQDSLTSGYAASDDGAVALPAEAAGFAAPSPMLEAGAQPSVQRDNALEAEAVVAAAPLVEDAPVAGAAMLSSAAVMEDAENSVAGAMDDSSATGDEAMEVLPAPTSPSSPIPVEENSVSPATPSAVALAEQSETSTQKRIDAPTPAAAMAAPDAEMAASPGVELLPWLQLALTGAVLIFGLLWWRSRR
jgi:anti-sigma factor RsiW